MCVCVCTCDCVCVSLCVCVCVYIHVHVCVCVCVCVWFAYLYTEEAALNGIDSVTIAIKAGFSLWMSLGSLAESKSIAIIIKVLFI